MCIERLKFFINHILGFCLTTPNHIWIVFSFDQTTLNVHQTFLTDVKIIVSVFECSYALLDIDCETWIRFAGHIGSKNNLIAMHVPGT